MSDAGRPVELRDMTDGDLDEGLRLSRASGWNQTLDDWRQLLRLGPSLFRVALEDDRVVACGGAACHGGTLVWICMILVDPERRGRGLGTRVFDDVLERVRARAGGGEAVGLDATPAGLGIYAARGFVRDADLLRMAASPGLPVAAPPDVQPLAAHGLESILDLDRHAFGADRGPLLRWAAASAPELARVASARGRVRGYCLGRRGDHSDHVGPVVAEDVAVARDLVAACRAQPRSRPMIVDARADPGWRAVLGDLGFAARRPLTRMYRGPARPPARPALEPAVMGPEFG